MAIVWTGGIMQALATCSTGTETAPTTAADGLALDGLGGFAVHVEAGAALTAGTLAAYIRNPVSGAWNRANDLDVNVRASQKAQGFAGFAVSSPAGRVAYVPVGIGVACSIHLVGTRPIR